MAGTKINVSGSTSCMRSIVTMLQAIPMIANMIIEKKYKSDSSTTTEVLDELFNIFTSKGKSVKDLIDLLSYYSDCPQMFYGRNQNFEQMFFNEVYQTIKTELHFCDEKVKKLWSKFTSGLSTSIQLKKEQSDANSRSMTDALNHRYGNKQLSEILIVTVPQVTQGKPPFIPESKMNLINKQQYELVCVINKDEFGEYKAVTVNNSASSYRQNRALHYLSGKEVLSRRNYAYIYVQKVGIQDSRADVQGSSCKDKPIVCEISGCPSEEKFKDKKSLKRHQEYHHKTCKICNELFLLHCVYKEHLKYCIKTNDSRRAPTSPEKKVSEKKQEKKVRFDDKVQYKYFNKDEETRECSSRSCKRKTSDQDTTSDAKKMKCEDNVVCYNIGCNKIGNHWCHFPKVTELNSGFATKGIIKTDSCLVEGIPYYSQFLCSFLESHGILFLFKYNGGNTIRILGVKVGDSDQSFSYKIKLRWDSFSSSADGVAGEDRKILIGGYESSTLDYEIEITPDSC